MNNEFIAFRATELPNREPDKSAFFEIIGRNAFALVYDLDQRNTFLCIEAERAGKVDDMEKAIPGIRFVKEEYQILSRRTGMMVLSCYKRQEMREGEERHDLRHMHDIFDLSLGGGFVAVMFFPASEKEIENAKYYVEKELSRKEIRETRSAPTEMSNKRASSSTQRDLFMESEETALLNSMLSSMNKAILSNGLAYKQFLIIPKSCAALQEYIETRFVLLNESEYSTCLAELLVKLPEEKAYPLGTDYLKGFINFYGTCRLNYILPTTPHGTAKGIEVGTFMKDGATETKHAVRIEPSTMNLGCIITGLPGSGKTKEAMAIIDAVKAHSGGTRVIVVAPTGEWDNFASAHGMYLVRPYADNAPINLFRCPPTVQREKFYENLALVLASASNAGPYQNPMEYCLLNAFRRAYSETGTPNPVSVYDEIEEAIVRFHAKKTNTGIKYTKHGENIKSALENLRAILNRQEYSTSEGIQMEELLEKGLVFDLSGVSSEKRAYIYALLLNQVYALAADFDTDGDEELRLLICLEEAQTVFGNKESAAVQDLRQHIQDFRKQGIGLMLLVHTISDIEQGVRRLCQTKLYLKQAPDIAALAARDLVFTYASEEDAVLKLKLLDSRIGAFSYIVKENGVKHTQDTIFIKTAEYVESGRTSINALDAYMRRKSLHAPALIDMRFEVTNDADDEESKPKQGIRYVRFRHLGEELATHTIEGHSTITQKLIDGSEYLLQLLDRRERVINEFRIRACPAINIRIRADGIDLE
jgi:hypothetical protein